MAQLASRTSLYSAPSAPSQRHRRLHPVCTRVAERTPGWGASTVAPSRPQPSKAACSSSGDRMATTSPPETRAMAVSAAAPTAPAAAIPAATTPADRDDFAVDQRPVILFDGVCNLCNGGVNFMLDNDPRGAFRLAALQSAAGRRLLRRCGRSPDDISSIVLVERGRHFIRSEAILRIGAALRVPLPLLAALGFPVPLPLRDAFYDAVANNRYSFFGRTDACRLRDAGKFADRFVVD